MLKFKGIYGHQVFWTRSKTISWCRSRSIPLAFSPIPPAAVLLGDRGCNAERFINSLIDMGISPGIPSRTGRKVPIPHDADRDRSIPGEHCLPKRALFAASFGRGEAECAGASVLRVGRSQVRPQV